MPKLSREKTAVKCRLRLSTKRMKRKRCSLTGAFLKQERLVYRSRWSNAVEGETSSTPQNQSIHDEFMNEDVEDQPIANMTFCQSNDEENVLYRSGTLPADHDDNAHTDLATVFIKSEHDVDDAHYGYTEHSTHAGGNDEVESVEVKAEPPEHTELPETEYHASEDIYHETDLTNSTGDPVQPVETDGVSPENDLKNVEFEFVEVKQEIEDEEPSLFKNHGFTCEKCSITYSTLQYLHAHEKLCTSRRNIQRKTFSCTECSYTTPFIFSLKRHSVTHNRTTYSCSLCKFQPSTKNSLKRHMFTHTGERPFACAECDYRTTERSNLKHHMYTHTGEKPYACTVCSFKTTVRANLKKHALAH